MLNIYTCLFVPTRHQSTPAAQSHCQLLTRQKHTEVQPRRENVQQAYAGCVVRGQTAELGVTLFDEKM